MSLLGKLAVSVVGDTKELNRTFKEVGDKSAALQSKMQKLGQRIGDTGKNMTKWVTGPVAAAGAGILGLASKTADYGDQVAKTSQKVGLSVESYQELKFALGQAGLAENDFEKALGRLNQRIGMARDGNEKYTEALQRLGFGMEDIQSGALDTEDSFMQIIESLNQMEDSQQQSALAAEIFGVKLSRELMPAIQGGAEGLEEARQKARELGIVMDEEAAKKSEEFGDAVDDLKRSFGGVFQEMGTNLIPMLVDDFIPMLQKNVIPLVRDFGEWIGKLIEWFSNLSPEWQKTIVAAAGLAAAIGPVLVVLGTLVSSLSALAPLFAALTGPVGAVIAILGGLVAAGVAVYKNWDKIKAKAEEVWTGIKDFFKNTWEAITGFFKEYGEEILLLIVGPAGWVTLLMKRLDVNWEEVRNSIQNVWNGIKNFFSDTWNSMLSRFGSFKSGFINRWNSLKDGVRGIVNSIIGFGNGILRGWERIINGMSRAINRLPSFNIPDWVPGLGGNTYSLPRVPTVSLPRIPQLAQGGNILGAGLAEVGERGREIVRLPQGAQVQPLPAYGQSDSDNGINMARLFEGANIYIRDDSDIKKLAREVKRLYDDAKRGQGVK